MNKILSIKTIKNQIDDKIKVVIYCQAIGDALGLGTGFINKNEIQKWYPQGFLSSII